MISEQELVLIAGASTFFKGKNIYQKGKVQLQAQSANEITGLVSGRYDYRTAIYPDSGSYAFSCTCPAFEYQEVCKHCVALTLTYIDSSQNGEVHTNTNKPSFSPENTLKSYIESLPTEKLHSALYKLICEDKYQYNQWLNKAHLASNEQDLKSLKKLVTKALPLKDIWEYRKAAEYFTNAEQIIIDVLESAKKLSPLDELKLIFHMYDRLEKIFERVDDSGGYRFGVQYQISLALCSTISIQEWNTNQKAKWLIDALEYEYDSFPDIPYDFQLSEAEMSAFLSICQTQFDQYEVCSDIAKRERNYDLQTRGQILLNLLPQAKEYEAALKIKVKMASELNDALSISQFCLDNDDELTAEDWLLNAKKLISKPHQKNNWNEQAINVYTALGETERAWHMAWQMFTERPSQHAWQKLQKHTETIGYKPDNLKLDVEAQLLQVSKKEEPNWLRPPNTDIVDFYLSDNQFDKAVDWLDKNKAGEHVLKEAAVCLAPHFPDKAINYCTRALSIILRHAESKNYQEAVSVLKKIDDRLPDEQQVNQSFEKLVRGIANENCRRPNLMKLLRSQFTHYL